MEIVLAVLGLLTGSGVTSVAMALLQRRWQKGDELAAISKKLDAHCKTDDERYFKQCRTRILRFNDEVIRGLHHTEEHFNDVLEDITEYNNYCNEHKDFKNAKAVMAIENIQRVYMQCMEDDSFLRAAEIERRRNMAKFSYINHLYEVTAIAVELPCGFGEAWDRFRADVAAGEATDNTGGILQDFDFKGAGEKWNAMSEAEQQAARNEWYALMQTETGVYKRDMVLALCDSYKAGKV